MTNVIVLPSPQTPAAPNPEAINRQPLPLHVALATEWQTDAHLCLYQTTEDQWPRLSKGVLADLPPQTVSLGITLLDWDTPGHAPLTDADKASLLSALSASPDLAPTWRHWTRAGARLIYEHDPLAPEDAEGFHRGLVAAWAQRGLVLDPGTWEWNRIFRLPNVERDGQSLRSEVVSCGGTFNHSRIPRLSHRRVLSPVTLRLPQPQGRGPDPLLWRPKATGGGLKLTSWGLDAKRRLKGRLDGALDDLFDLSPPTVPSPRNDTLMKWIGSSTSLLHSNCPGTTPEHLFALFAPAATQSTRPGDRDLVAETWKMILYCWARETAEAEALEAERQDATEEILDSPGVSFPNKATLLKHLVISVGRDYYVLHKDGYYRGPHVKDHLYSVLRDAGLEDVLPLTVPSPTGDRPIRSNEIIDKHHTPLTGGVRRKPGPPDSGWIEGRDLVVGSFQRNPSLTPRFDPEVDRWFRAFAGLHYDVLSKWIGLALAFEKGPICALSIKGPPNIGKKLLVKGLAECISPPKLATAEAFGDWQYGLDSTPFLSINEGWPPIKGPIDVMFRKLVSGDTIEIKKKYRSNELVEISPRVILTANNRRMVEQLFGRNSDDLDQNAVAERLLHVELSSQARDVFATVNWANWISGSAHETSSFKVARHFLTFYEKHKDSSRPGRFLMQGETAPELITLLTTSEGLPALVSEILCDLYAQGRLRSITQKNLLWVTSHEVLAMLEWKWRGRLPSLNKVGRLIAPFRLPNGPRVFTDPESRKSTAGHCLDRNKIHSLAHYLGFTLPERETNESERLRAIEERDPADQEEQRLRS